MGVTTQSLGTSFANFFLFFFLYCCRSLWAVGVTTQRLGTPFSNVSFLFYLFFGRLREKFCAVGVTTPKFGNLTRQFLFVFSLPYCCKSLWAVGSRPKVWETPLPNGFCSFFFIEPNQVAQKGKPIDFDVIDRVPSGGTRLSTHRPSGFVF